MNTDRKSSYYDVGGISALDIIRAKLSTINEDAAEGFHYNGYICGLVYCLMKYAVRFPFKGSAIRDLEKIVVYAGLIKEALLSQQQNENI